MIGTTGSEISDQLNDLLLHKNLKIEIFVCGEVAFSTGTHCHFIVKARSRPSCTFGIRYVKFNSITKHGIIY